MIEFIIFILLWGIAGEIYGLCWVNPYKISNYKPFIIFIGGPAWWIIYLIFKNKKIN